LLKLSRVSMVVLGAVRGLVGAGLIKRLAGSKKTSKKFGGSSKTV
jgi:Na+-translocating ferredoxin:NAD+ oxidoreductase RnfE subunit